MARLPQAGHHPDRPGGGGPARLPGERREHPPGGGPERHPHPQRRRGSVAPWTAAPTTRRGASAVADAAHRLPRTVAPERYELTLTPDLDAATFAGEERIEVRVQEPVAEIVLNAIELDILSAELVSEDGHRLGGTVTLDEEAELATIALSDTAAPGTWFLHLTFTGILNDKLHGFYRSTFRDADGHECVIATTQFEATD